jgi:site-specific DNA recombinase
MKAAIYARYSSDLQKDTSITDQLALCSHFANGNGYKIVGEYTDKARSGASLMGRDGVLDLMADAKLKRFDTVIVESLDRLSRDQEDLSGIYKCLSFSGIQIIAVHDGKADPVQIGVRGLLGSLYLADLAHKVRRGMTGRVAEGKSQERASRVSLILSKMRPLSLGGYIKTTPKANPCGRLR